MQQQNQPTKAVRLHERLLTDIYEQPRYTVQAGLQAGASTAQLRFRLDSGQDPPS